MAEVKQHDIDQRATDEKKEQEHKVAEKRAKLEKEQPSGCLIFIVAFLLVAWLLGEMGASSNGGLAIFLIIVVAIAIMVIINKDKDSKLDTLKEEIHEEQLKKRSVMDQVFDDAKLNGFEPTTKVYDPENRYCIATDDRTRKFLIKNTPDAKFLLFNYSDLVDFELSQDGVSTISSRASDALAGGILFGATGAVIGASKSKDIEEYCSSLYVGLTVKDASALRIQIPIISRKILKTTSEYTYAVERAKEMVALLSLIKTENEKNKERMVSELDTIEAIKKYKELLDLGIITQDEFETKRKELLKIY